VKQRVEKLLVRSDGRELDCRCFATPLSRSLFAAIVGGKTYPRVPFVRDVRTILDVGANVGAASVYFALCYPDAAIHALEPAREPFALLAHNAGHFPNVRVHNVGLFREDRRAPLFLGETDSVTASVGASEFNGAEAETIDLRGADAWLAEQRIDAVDVLKLDTEGCEVAILEAMGAALAATKVIYVEYHSEEDRLRIDALLHPSHILVAGQVIHLHRGEFTYVARAAFPSAAACDERKIVVSL
jgi:FkbM family methyltransferase